jgi:hypothetical protein
MPLMNLSTKLGVKQRNRSSTYEDPARLSHDVEDSTPATPLSSLNSNYNKSVDDFENIKITAIPPMKVPKVSVGMGEGSLSLEHLSSHDYSNKVEMVQPPELLENGRDQFNDQVPYTTSPHATLTNFSEDHSTLSVPLLPPAPIPAQLARQKSKDMPPTSPPVYPYRKTPRIPSQSSFKDPRKPRSDSIAGALAPQELRLLLQLRILVFQSPCDSLLHLHTQLRMLVVTT